MVDCISAIYQMSGRSFISVKTHSSKRLIELHQFKRSNVRGLENCDKIYINRTIPYQYIKLNMYLK